MMVVKPSSTKRHCSTAFRQSTTFRCAYWIVVSTSQTRRREYDSLVAADTAFSSNPEARRDFFYKRSPWAEPMFNVYPVLRIPAPTTVELLRP